jgi:hypothetical protein
MERFFLTILIMQMLSYGIVDYYKIKYGRFSVLSIFLILFLVVFPIHFKIGEEEETNSIFCLYNTFAYFEVYWNIGIVLVLSSHFIYCYLINRKSKIVK